MPHTKVTPEMIRADEAHVAQIARIREERGEAAKVAFMHSCDAAEDAARELAEAAGGYLTLTRAEARAKLAAIEQWIEFLS